MPFRPEPTPPDITKLKSILLNSGIQKDNQPLYQVLWSLIDFVARGQSILESQITEVSGGGGGGSSTSTTTQIIQQLLFDSEGGDDDADVIPGPRGIDGANGMVPYFIAAGEIFTVPIFKQALFSMNIDNEGILEINGFLIEVDGTGPQGDSITWTTEPYNAANFTASSGTWTTSNITAFVQYAKSGQWGMVKVNIFSTSLSATPLELRVAMPPALTPAGSITTVVPVRVNDSGGIAMGFALVNPALGYIAFQKLDGATIFASGGTVAIQGEVMFEIVP